MGLFSTTDLWDFLIFVIGVFGFIIAEKVQCFIASCPKNKFAVAFIITVYVMLCYIKNHPM